MDRKISINSFHLSERYDFVFVSILSFIHYWILAIAWPIGPGRDSMSYLAYFFDFGNPNPHDKLFMSIRTPLPSFVFAYALEHFGSPAIEWGMCLFSVLGMLCFFYFAKIFSRKIAYVALACLLLQLGYQSVFHVVSSDSPTDIFCLYFLFFFFTALLQGGSKARIFIAGLCVGLMFLSRPTHQLFLVFSFVPIFYKGIHLKKKAALICFFLLGALPAFLGWATYNYKQSGAFTLSRATNIMSPMWSVWVADKTIAAENGPHTREFLDAIKSDILSKEKYKSAGTTVEQYVQAGDYNEKVIELMDMIDLRWGKKSNYIILRNVALEAIFTHPFQYFPRVVLLFLKGIIFNYKHPVPLRSGVSVYTHKHRVAFVGDDASDQFVPIDSVDLKVLKNSPNYRLALEKQDKSILQAYDLQMKELPPRNGNISVGTFFNWIAQLYIPMPVWIAVFLYSLFALGFYSQSEGLLLFCILFGLGHFLTGCMTVQVHIYQYRFFFEPIYILAGVLGFFKLAKLTEREVV